jgi:hypothetical protein
MGMIMMTRRGPHTVNSREGLQKVEKVGMWAEGPARRRGADLAKRVCVGKWAMHGALFAGIPRGCHILFIRSSKLYIHMRPCC